MLRQHAQASVINRLLGWCITVLALADGLVHFALNDVLFHGRFWGAPRFQPPPGGHVAPPPPPPATNPLFQALDIGHITGLPLNELFVLNAIGYLVLLLVFWCWPRRWHAWRWLVDVVLLGYVTASIIAWLNIGKPNPHGLGYLSKRLEVALIAALLVHVGFLVQDRAVSHRSMRPLGRSEVHS